MSRDTGDHLDKEVGALGSTALTVVPLPVDSMLTSPPKGRRRSFMLLTPTPDFRSASAPPDKPRPSITNFQHQVFTRAKYSKARPSNCRNAGVRCRSFRHHPEESIFLVTVEGFCPTLCETLTEILVDYGFQSLPHIRLPRNASRICPIKVDAADRKDSEFLLRL